MPRHAARPRFTRHSRLNGRLFIRRSQPVVAVTFGVATPLFVSAPARAIPVATRLIAVRIAIAGLGAILCDFRTDFVKYLSSHLLVLLDLLALTSSAIGHGDLPAWKEMNAVSKRYATDG